MEISGPKELRVKTDMKLSRQQTGNKYTCRFSAKDVRAIKEESSMPPWWSFNPTVFASNGKWENYAALLNVRLEKAASVSEKAAVKAKELCLNAKNLEDKLITIRDFIAKSIRNAGPGLNSLPFDCISDADITLKDAYGNNTDRAVLIYAMLKAVGVDAGFVLISPYEPVFAVVNPIDLPPQQELYSSILVKVTMDRNPIYLNDTNQYAELGSTAHEKNLSMKLPSGNTEVIRIRALHKNSPRLSTTTTTYIILKIDEEGNALMTRTVRYYGMAYQSFYKAFAEMTPELRKRYCQGAAAAVSESATMKGELVTDYKVYPGIEEMTLEIKKYAVKDDKFMYFPLPGFHPATAVSAPTLKRENPFYVGYSSDWTCTYQIELPSGVDQILSAPRNISWEGLDNFGRININSNHDGNKLNVSMSVNTNSAFISDTSYLALVEINRILSKSDMKMVLMSLK